jgi:hypothetical protein
MDLNLRLQSIVSNTERRRVPKRNLASAVVENQPHALPCLMRKLLVVPNVNQTRCETLAIEDASVRSTCQPMDCQTINVQNIVANVGKLR